MKKVYGILLDDNYILHRKLMGYVETTENLSEANYYITNAFLRKSYIMNQYPNLLVCQIHKLYNDMYPFKEYDKNIFIESVKMIMSNDINSIKLGIDLLISMDLRTSTNMGTAIKAIQKIKVIDIGNDDWWHIIIPAFSYFEQTLKEVYGIIKY